MHLKGARHAPHRAGWGDCHAEADVEVVPDIRVLAILGQAELLARRHQEGALVSRGPEIVEAEQHLIAVPASLEILGLFGRAIGRHPGDELGLARERRPLRGQGRERRGGCEARRSADQKFASAHQVLSPMVQIPRAPLLHGLRRGRYRSLFARNRLSSNQDLLRRLTVVFEPHAEHATSAAEFGEIEPVTGAGVDHQFDNAWLPFRQAPAIRRRRHGVLRADDNQRGKLELSVRLVGAGRIEGRRGPEPRPARDSEGGASPGRRDRERRVGPLREADYGDPRRH